MTGKAAPHPKGWHVVTDEHFKLFEQYIIKWQALLNLRDWRCELSPIRCKSNMAELLSVEHEHKLARFRLGETFKRTPVTPRSLEDTAIHEMLHLFLRALIDNSIAEGEHGQGVAETEHACIVVLTPLLLEAYGERNESDGKGSAGKKVARRLPKSSR